VEKVNKSTAFAEVPRYVGQLTYHGCHYCNYCNFGRQNCTI